MKIENKSGQNVSWFCYNDDDVVKGVALGSGNVMAGASTSYTPPKNTRDRYFVRFTNLGGGNELAGKQVSRDGTVVYS